MQRVLSLPVTPVPDGLLTRYAHSMKLEKPPIVRPKPDDFVFTAHHNESVNLFLVMAFGIMWFTFFLVCLYMFAS